MKMKDLKKVVKKFLGLSMVAVLMVSSMVGCSNQKEASSNGAKNDEVKKIVIGTCMNFEDVAFTNKDGKLDGFEVELLKEVNKLLPQYEFEIQQLAFDNILLSLDAGKVDVGSSMYEYSEERAKNYLFGKEGYRDYSIYFYGLAGKGNTTWSSLAGKTVGTYSATDNSTLTIENYNKKNPDKAIKIDYTGDISKDVEYKSLEEGRWDAIYTTRAGYEKDKKEYGDKFELGDLITKSEAYWVYPKDGKHDELQKAMDGALQTLKKDGTLNKLSNKWFGSPAYYEK